MHDRRQLFSITIQSYLMMMLQFATKSRVSVSFLRWNKPASHGRATFGNVANSNVKANDVARSNRTSTLPLSLGLNYDTNVGFTATCIKPGYTSLGNPFTMAFLAKRAKSSCAASINHDVDGEDINGAAIIGRTHAGVLGGRSYQEAWMVNLGRGDDAWLPGPRSADWFTGLHPTVCPGKCTLLSLFASEM